MKIKKVHIIFPLLLIIVTTKTFGQIYINEFVCSNSSVNTDPEFGDYSDWIELYNAGNNPVDLAGYYLTDNLKNPIKWKIPKNTVIGAKNFLVIYTDGKDTALHTSYKLSLAGEEIGLFSPVYNIVDSIVYTFEKPNISHGRKSDGSSTWAYFPIPTPGHSNNNSTSYLHLTDNIPQFSIKGGFFSSPVSLELSSYLGGTIRYTIDGSEPSSSSALYSAPISISYTTVIRARIFKTNSYPGDIITNTYFFNEHFIETGLPVVSLATDPENFWDPVKGIYVQDFKPDWEIPVNIELFENDGSDRAGFNQMAGTKVNGLYSWQLPQKMLGIYFKKRYGSGNLDYPIIPQIKRNSYKSFALRASGNDWSYTLFRDGMSQNLTQYNTDIDIQEMRPCVVYVNGDYLGIHNIRPKIDNDYIASNYYLDPDSFDIIENENYAEAGSLDEYKILKTALSEDLSVNSNFDDVAKIMDITNFTDYVIAELCTGNSSVDHNVFAWKPKGRDKWRWILVDLDRGFFSPSSRMIDYYIDRTVFPFYKLMKNDDYKHYFGRRLADQLFTAFNPQRVSYVIDQHKNAIYNEVPYHLERWKGTTSTYGNAIPSFSAWESNVGDLKTYAKNRPVYLLEDLKKYGFDEPANLRTIAYPPTGGNILLNGLRIPFADCSGLYPINETITLEAKAKPGFDFKGWANKEGKIIIPTGDTWKYLDNGTYPGDAWYQLSFSDDAWKSGNAKFGYGDDNENTTLDYGSNSQNKYVTSYFRKKFTVDNSQNISSATIKLLRDDGAIVYLNGNEIVRDNMPSQDVTFETYALNSTSGSEETTFQSFTINPDLILAGENIIAAEIHQNSGSSSDLGFDISLSVFSNNNIISNNKVLTVDFDKENTYTAIFEQTSGCIVPDTINENISLNLDCSPFYVNNDIVINQGATLTIDPGVEIYMSPGNNIFVHGKIVANGEASSNIKFKINPNYPDENWGAICLINSPDTSIFKHVIITDASQGPKLTTEVAAISAFYANVKLDNIEITDVASNPIAARYSSIWMTNSKLYSKVTGDLINVKYGYGYIRNCNFRGNDKPDTDAIDYDDVKNGVISNCEIYDFVGFNSDAIDIGEKALNILIDSVLIYNITDKGISVGQQSSAKVKNSTILNCNLGLGLKDSCHVRIDNCTFYGNRIPVSCFEKNIGSAGGNAWVKNSILSNSALLTYFADDRSFVDISYSLSDNDTLPENKNNLFADPRFSSPGDWNFGLQPGSPAIYSGQGTNMGTLYSRNADISYPVITGIYFNIFNEPNKTEFITIANPTTENIDISGYTFTDGIMFTFPENTILSPGEEALVAKFNDISLKEPGNDQYFKWVDGNLSNEGEQIQLEDKYGILVDYVKYGINNEWPEIKSRVEDGVLRVTNTSLDNHFGKNWAIASYDDLVEADATEPPSFALYPNPAHDIINIKTEQAIGSDIRLYSVTGKLLLKQEPKNSITSINLNSFNDKVIIVKYGSIAKKVIRY